MWTRGFMLWGDNKEWLGSRLDKWVAQCQGYTRLRSRRLSRGCQTMLDRPAPFWSRSDTELLNDLVPEQPAATDNINISSLSLGGSTPTNNNTPEPETLSFSDKQLQYDQDVADYIAYLNRPVINMNDHYIEIHQFHYEPACFKQTQEPPVRPPTRRRKHKIDLKKTEVVDTRGISTINSAEYCEFLVRKSPEGTQNIRVVSGRTSDEENRDPDQLDQHRPLAQGPPAEKRVDTVVSREGQVKVKRGETFTSRSPAAPRPPPRGFLSFRTNKKNKSGRRKKRIVVGEAGMDGPIWPAVLLTFDRSLSPAPPESPDESEV